MSVEGGPQSAPFKESQAIQLRTSYGVFTVSQIREEWRVGQGAQRRGAADRCSQASIAATVNFLQYAGCALRENKPQRRKARSMLTRPARETTHDD
jgi:hypothetical protein